MKRTLSSLVVFCTCLLPFTAQSQCTNSGTPVWNPLPSTGSTTGTLNYPSTTATGSVNIVSGGTTTFFPTPTALTNPTSFNKSASGTATITFNIAVSKSSVGESFKLSSVGTSEGQSITATDEMNVPAYPTWVTTMTATIGGITNNEITGTGSNGASEFSFSVPIKSLTIGPKSGVTATSAVTVIFQTLCAAPTIPVELTFFKGHEHNGRALLTWQTVSEKNNVGFDIQRSFDAQTWQNIGFVKGQGQSNTIQNYAFEDNTPLSIWGHSTVYFRLRQMDNDGGSTLTQIVGLSLKGNAKGFRIYPNPILNKTATLELDIDAEGGTLQILNALGAVVKTEILQTRLFTLDLTTFTEGIYFVVFKSKTNHFVQKVFITD